MNKNSLYFKQCWSIFFLLFFVLFCCLFLFLAGIVKRLLMLTSEHFYRQKVMLYISTKKRTMFGLETLDQLDCMWLFLLSFLTSTILKVENNDGSQKIWTRCYHLKNSGKSQKGWLLCWYNSLYLRRYLPLSIFTLVQAVAYLSSHNSIWM